MRVLLFTGKGGVGKTTTAAATALRIAEQGQRVIVTSADPAHSLSDSMGIELGTEPIQIAPRCWAQQLDARERLEENWGEIRVWMMEVLDVAGARRARALRRGGGGLRSDCRDHSLVVFTRYFELVHGAVVPGISEG